MTESTTAVVESNWWPSKVCSEAYFRRVIAATDTAYFLGGRKGLPDVKRIAELMGKGTQTTKLQKVLISDEFKAAMIARNIPWSTKRSGITPEQNYALHIMTDPSNAHKAFNARLKSAGINYRTWSAWLKQPLFRSAYQALTESLIEDNVGTAHTALVAKVAQGDMRAIEFMYRISGRFDPDREATMNMNAILMGILEILMRRITDEQLLSQISEDMERLVNGNKPLEITAVPYEDELDKAPVGEPPTVFSFTT